ATLDKYRRRLDQVSTRLTALEFEQAVTLHDVLTVVQRSELVKRMAVEIERFIVELGAEGRLIEMQLEETMVGVAMEKAALVHDYIDDPSDEHLANVQLMPDPTILSLETGTRHRTAERVSKQTDALVIAISAGRGVVSLYLDGAKYILEDIPVVLAKANQALATLDKYRSRLDQVSTRLTALEFEGGVTLHDVLTVLQRAELVTRMAVEIERFIVELGAEGRLIEMQLEETMVGVAADKSALVRDYIVEATDEGHAMVLDSLARLPHQDMLDFGRLAELLGYDRKLNTLDHPASPRGHRILGRIPRLPRMVVHSIVAEFTSLDEILAAGDADLESVEGVGDLRAKDIREGLRRLQEINLVDRYLQT
ncbi:MAG TPA: DNA integrity scanning diadenylate cyclase DisA, partial [Thermoleophilaceae bacterium]|nr:DNA integrity scanning diadenylate cyclase DisA [Thermoleophilaceae bacterium]